MSNLFNVATCKATRTISSKNKNIILNVLRTQWNSKFKGINDIHTLVFCLMAMRKIEWCDVIIREVSRRAYWLNLFKTNLLDLFVMCNNRKLKPNKNSVWHAFIIMIKLPLRRWENYWNWKKIEIYILCWFAFNILLRRFSCLLLLCKKIESIMLMEFLITLFIYHCWISFHIFPI